MYKTVFKYYPLVIISIIVLAFAACSHGDVASKNDGKHMESEMNHNNISSPSVLYACPMHHEITSDKPGSCSICGMNLVAMTKNELQKTFTMKFSSEPQTIIAKQEASLSFIPKNIEDSTAVIPLDVVHEKKIHLIVVSNDLSWSQHIHPELKSDGGYEVTAKFPFGGDFVMFADYTPTGFSNQVTRIPITVSGNQLEAKKYSVQKLIWQGDDGYKAEINTDEKLIPGKETMLKVLVTKNEKPVTDLDVYLGALGHFAIISEDTKKYLHVHPMDLRVKGPEIIFHTEFETAGTYRGFLQFNHAEKIHTADFVLILQ